MEKYRTQWIEYHDPYNWGITEKEGIKELRKSLPVIDIHPDPNENDGWMECICEEVFEAENSSMAFAYALYNVDMGDSNTFSIFDRNNIVIATEEGLVKYTRR